MKIYAKMIIKLKAIEILEEVPNSSETFDETNRESGWITPLPNFDSQFLIAS